MTRYIALIHKDPASDYGVSFPDFPGCVTAGATLDEAREMAAEALTGHLATLAEDSVAAPAPSSLESVAAMPDAADAVAIIAISAGLGTAEFRGVMEGLGDALAIVEGRADAASYRVHNPPSAK